MLNREKVIKGLQCIIDGTVRCESCGYAIDKHGHHSCQQNCASDAIALLKEQEPIQMKISEDYESIKFGECPKCKAFINNRSYPKSCGCGQKVTWE